MQSHFDDRRPIEANVRRVFFVICSEMHEVVASDRRMISGFRARESTRMVLTVFRNKKNACRR